MIRHSQFELLRVTGLRWRYGLVVLALIRQKVRYSVTQNAGCIYIQWQLPRAQRGNKTMLSDQVAEQLGTFVIVFCIFFYIS